MTDGSSTPSPGSTTEPQALSPGGRYLVLVTAFLGWMFAGTQMAVTSIVMRPAAKDLLGSAGDQEGLVGSWFAYYVCAFLFGAAAGGLFFGWLGDRYGRTKGMAAAILCYSVLAGCSYFAQDTWQLLILRFLACMGVGGMWPNGVALVSEAWSNLSRPMIAGLIGTAANVGIMGMSYITKTEGYEVGPENWRMAMLVSGSPVILGLFAAVAVPESPLWLATRRDAAIAQTGKTPTPIAEVFGPPYLRVVLVGIILATVPLLGGWGTANWMVPWAGEVGEKMTPPDLGFKSDVVFARSVTGVIGSFLGGWIGSLAGRRTTYFVVSLVALGSAEYTFWFLDPSDKDSFLLWVSVLGFFSGIYFGWLPLCLPEMFPTRVRSTGAGVSFNFGRILTAVTVFASGALLAVMASDEGPDAVSKYAKVGRITSAIFLIGMIAILFAPDTSKKQLED